MSPLSTPSQQGYHVQTVKPLTFILQLPNSSVRCNCASHQPELGLLNCPPQAFILLQYRDYHVPTVPPNIHSITAIANMYNLFLKHSSLSHAFVCQDFKLTECFLNTYINDETKNQNNDMRMKYCLQPIQSRSTLKPLCLGNVHVQLIPYQWTNVF